MFDHLDGLESERLVLRTLSSLIESGEVDRLAEQIFLDTSMQDFLFLLGSPADWSAEGMKQYLLGRPIAVPNISVALFEKETEKWVASTRLMTIDEVNKTVEIGHTLIGRSWRGTWVNPAMKQMLMEFLFEKWGANRVQLKADARNERSVAAMRALGFVHEGVLRKHMVALDGFVRDTVMFSVIAEEWPDCKRLLAEKAASRPS